ncbi:MAG TPA: hypothetical protein VFU21_23105 [Kofleriaceae bacterium]|nr:hypothetical protein [Kofleriaceae bacterium]
MSQTYLAAALFVVFSAACTGSAGDGGGEEVPPEAVVGHYQVTSTYNAAGALPDVATETLGILDGLADDPAGTLIDLAEEAGAPIDWVPDGLRDRFADWVNEYIASRVFQGAPVTEEIARWTQDIAGMLHHFDIISAMDLATVDGSTAANHVLAAVAFDFRGARRVVDTPEIVNQLTVARDVSCSIVDAGGGEARLDVGDHAFHMPLGDFAVVGFNTGLQQVLGIADLHAALELLIDCPGLADEVSSKCFGPVCVGHRDEIESFCRMGIDLVVEEVESRIASIEFAELHLTSGEAAMLDAGKDDSAIDGTFDQIDRGVWQAMVNIDGVELPVDATFIGARQ